MDYVDLEKLKWHSRRSMLELDLYFDRFLRQDGLTQLTEDELSAYKELLEYEDDEILGLFWRKDIVEDKILQSVIDKICSLSKHAICN
ncbi:MAG: citrate synthase [Pseudomonadota bacterium]|nr:citrate synthase [Pseudomonadota bacterium]